MTSLLSEAEKYTQLGFSIIPIRDKRPVIESWTNRRGVTATQEELGRWFGSTGAAECIGIILDQSLLVIETDGSGERVFNERIFPKLSYGTQQAYRNTTHTVLAIANPAGDSWCAGNSYSVPNLEEWLTADFDDLLAANKGNFLKNEFGGTILYQKDAAAKRKKLQEEVQEFKRSDKTKG